MKREDLEAEMIEYFTEEMDIFDEDYIESEIDNIICIAKNIRSKLTYNNGIYYPVENLFKDYNNLDNNYKCSKELQQIYGLCIHQKCNLKGVVKYEKFNIYKRWDKK